MEMFGWSLQSRQEIREEGEAYSRPSLLGDEYIIKTKVYHYVKLHFTRNLSLPNLDKVKQIESEYFSLPFPPPPSWKGPIILTAIWLFIVPCGLMAIEGTLANIVYLGGIALCGFWFYSTWKKRKAARQICEQSLHRAKELVAQLETVGYG
jgi:hypothetical protein